MKVIIFGAGPAGMFAAAACQNFGVMWEVWGKAIPRVSGPVFFHEPLVPSVRPAIISMQVQGTSGGYAARQLRVRTSADYFGMGPFSKVAYRAGWDPNVQMDMFHLSHMQHFRLGMDINKDVEAALSREPEVHIISTLPHPDLIRYPFPILVHPLEVGPGHIPTHFINYIGHPGPRYLRHGQLWGEVFFEYSDEYYHKTDPELLELLKLDGVRASQEVRRIVAFNTHHDPVPEHKRRTRAQLLTGRFATRNNRMLAHHSYLDTWTWLEELYR